LLDDLGQKIARATQKIAYCEDKTDLKNIEITCAERLSESVRLN